MTGTALRGTGVRSSLSGQLCHAASPGCSLPCRLYRLRGRAVGRDPLCWDPCAQRLLRLQSRGWEQQPRREVVQEGGTREGRASVEIPCSYRKAPGQNS